MKLSLGVAFFLGLNTIAFADESQTLLIDRPDFEDRVTLDSIETHSEIKTITTFGPCDDDSSTSCFDQYDETETYHDYYVTADITVRVKPLHPEIEFDEDLAVHLYGNEISVSLEYASGQVAFIADRQEKVTVTLEKTSETMGEKHIEAVVTLTPVLISTLEDLMAATVENLSIKNQILSFNVPKLGESLPLAAELNLRRVRKILGDHTVFEKKVSLSSFKSDASDLSRLSLDLKTLELDEPLSSESLYNLKVQLRLDLMTDQSLVVGYKDRDILYDSYSFVKKPSKEAKKLQI